MVVGCLVDISFARLESRTAPHFRGVALAPDIHSPAVDIRDEKAVDTHDKLVLHTRGDYDKGDDVEEEVGDDVGDDVGEVVDNKAVIVLFISRNILVKFAYTNRTTNFNV